ncbi:MAG TPA: arsenate reductase ArsC [Aggregatilineales bacterium]|nr:arsenate reductase ArsC [Aggregatilineales bacterium]
MTTKNRILILCTGNSARSQLAEAIINAQRGDQWEAVSAGTKPAPQVHPAALQVLAEIGIQHGGTPKHMDTFKGQPFNLIITVCDSAAQECPFWPGGGIKLHIPFDDPAAVEGDEETILKAFRAVRDGIPQRMFPVLDGYMPSFAP